MIPNLRMIRTRLEKQLKSETLFSLVNTRLLLRTGVDLKNASDDADDETVAKVVEALAQLGYDVK